jgi:hypothetical protein
MQLINRIKRTVSICFDPKEFGEAVIDTAKGTFKSVEGANRALRKKTKRTIDANWKNFRQFINNLALGVVAVVAAAIYAVRTTITSFASVALMLAVPIFAIASYTGAFFIDAFLGGCLLLLALAHGLVIYPCIIFPYQVGAALVKKVRQTNKKHSSAAQAAQIIEDIFTEVASQPQPEAITDNPVVLVLPSELPSDLNNEKAWTQEKLIELCDLINAHHPDSISNHHFPGIKRRTLVRKIKDFYNHASREQAELSLAA